MKVYKIRKSDYLDYESMLKRVGAVSKDGKQAYPSHVYWNKKDDDKSIKMLKAEMKQNNDCRYPKKYIDTAVGIYHLNLGPNTLEGNPLKDGYMLVDTRAIENEEENVAK